MERGRRLKSRRATAAVAVLNVEARNRGNSREKGGREPIGLGYAIDWAGERFGPRI